MKAEKKDLIRIAELGIMRSLPDFLDEELKPGRLKLRFMNISMIIDGELRKIYKTNPTIYEDNKQELVEILDEFGKITLWGKDKSDVHIASVVAFCLAFLENTTSKYTPQLVPLLIDVLDYYERVGNLHYMDLWAGGKFKEEWDKLYG